MVLLFLNWLTLSRTQRQREHVTRTHFIKYLRYYWCFYYCSLIYRRGVCSSLYLPIWEDGITGEGYPKWFYWIRLKVNFSDIIGDTEKKEETSEIFVLDRWSGRKKESSICEPFFSCFFVQLLNYFFFFFFGNLTSDSLWSVQNHSSLICENTLVHTISPLFYSSFAVTAIPEQVSNIW